MNINTLFAISIVAIVALFLATGFKAIETGNLYEISCADGESELVTSEVRQEGNTYVYKNLFGVEVKAPVERCKLRKYMGN